jgi:peptidoglycan/xylan/chitin deacetylase (PgdA/CDA1 family)
VSWTSIIALALLALAAGAPALAEEAQAPQQCWAPQALAGTEAELKHVHSRQSLDLAPLKQATLPPATAIAPELRGSIRSVELPPGEKLIALTFDLCEENGYVSGYDGRVVDFLRVQGIKATFFAGGKWMETHPERAQQLIADPLFEIGSHGLRHLDLSHAKEQTLAEEITLTEAAYARARTALTARQCFAGASQQPQERLTLFRFPYGRCNDKALAATAQAGLVAVQWDHRRSRPARFRQDHCQHHPDQGASRRHRRGACQWPRPQHRCGARHRAAEAEGAGLQFRHGERALEGRQAGDLGALLSEQPR